MKVGGGGGHAPDPFIADVDLGSFVHECSRSAKLRSLTSGRSAARLELAMTLLREARS